MKFQTEQFVFKNVMRLHYNAIYWIAALSAALAIACYIILIRPLFFHGGLPLSSGLMLLAMMLIIKTQKKTVIIYFDQSAIHVGKGNGEFERFTKTEVAGIYSYDYIQRERAQVSISIILKNGRKIHLTDTQLFEKPDKERSLMLKRFLKAAVERLDLHYAGKNRWRAFQGTAACWYTAKP